MSGSKDVNGKSDEGVQVLCVGLMRTGLQSLHKALDTIGYENIYDQDRTATTYELWDNVLKNRSPKEAFSSMFTGCQVVMGMPTFCFWEDILEVYPNARVILTVRDENAWWNSVWKAKIAMDHDVPGAPLRYGTVRRHIERFLVPSYHKFCEVLRFAWATTLGATGLQGETLNESATRASFRRHNSYVRSQLGERETNEGLPQLLVFDVRQGWEPLCTFLGKEVPEISFPSVLDVPYFPDGQQRPEWLDRVTGFDELFAPDSKFGIKIRQELLRGLMVCGAVLTTMMALVLVATLFVTQIPVVIVALVYLGLMLIGWNVYGVMFRLVMRLPLLMVLPMTLKSLLIAAALHVCFISYGLFKEVLVTRDHIASPVLVLSSRLMSVACSALYLLLTERRISLGAPLWSMSAFAFTNEASTWAGYEMLKYVSFPVQVLAKSVKMLPNMIMGRVLNGTQYNVNQYAQAVAALVCVAIMHFSDEQAHDGRNGATEDMSFRYKLGMGIGMLTIFFVCDSFTSQWQTSLYTKHPKMSQTQMMLGGNLLGMILTSSTLVASWDKISASLTVAINNPAIMWRILGLGIVSALGQFCIYSAIRILGPLSFTWIMTARQLLSVLISLIFFGHGISTTKLLCIITVFGIMSSKQLSKALPQVAKVTRRLTIVRLGSKQQLTYRNSVSQKGD